MPRRISILEPSTSTSVGAWTAHEWPDHDETVDGSLVALRLPLPVAAGTPFVRNGWQSWSAPVVDRLGGRVVRSRRRSLTVGCRHPWEAPPYDGDESYDVLAAEGFVAGFLTGGGALVARPRHGDLLAVRERGGAQPAVMTATGDRAALVDDLLGRLAGRVPPRTPLGWSSWSVGGASFRLTDTELGADLAGAAALRSQGLLDAFHVDDGWMAAVGDWDRTTSTLTGLAGRDRRPGALAARIEAGGLEPGLWIAPFCAAPGSELVDTHPEWVLRDDTGAPVPAMHVAWWGGAVWALDVSRPDVQAWIADLAHALVSNGFVHLKVDFCYAAALAGRRRRPMTSDQAMRAALTALREGAGDAMLTGCGAPLWPAIGLVDAMRVGPDITSYWAPRRRDGIEDSSTACLRNAWRSAMLRAPLHGRAWANDPDAVLLRRSVELTPNVADAWARFVADSGGVLTFSDHFTDLDAAALDRWAALVDHRRQRRDAA